MVSFAQGVSIRRFGRFVRDFYGCQGVGWGVSRGEKVYAQTPPAALQLPTPTQRPCASDKRALYYTAYAHCYGDCLPGPARARQCLYIYGTVTAFCNLHLLFTVRDCGPALTAKHDTTESEHRAQIAVGGLRWLIADIGFERGLSSW